jgi:hypothetical protein
MSVSSVRVGGISYPLFRATLKFEILIVIKFVIESMFETERRENRAIFRRGHWVYRKSISANRNWRCLSSNIIKYQTVLRRA